MRVVKCVALNGFKNAKSFEVSIQISIYQSLFTGVLMLLQENYASKTVKSKQLYERAKRVLPAGVSYFIRYFEPYPFYIDWARGSKIKDVDGNVYIDFWMGHYTHILGHSPSNIVEAVKKQIEHGTHYGVCHELEIELAEQVVRMLPSAQMVRFSNSGTEAAMYATRLARAYTQRSKIVKFEGGWHGGYDALHLAVKPPFDMPESNGIAEGALKDTIVVPFNDLHETERKIKDQEVAAVIVEPVLGAGGCIPAEKEFLKGLRELCSHKDALLIFDEIITGFRLAPGGGQQYYGVIPDVTILGKILGGGFPIGAITGRRDIMERMDPLLFERLKLSFQGGTFTANPTTLSAGLEMLKTLEDGRIINRLNNEGEKVQRGLEDIFKRGNVDARVNRAGSLFHVHFTKEEVKNANVAYKADRKKLTEYHMALINNGVFFLLAKNGGISDAHSKEDLEKLLVETERYVKKSGSD
ncbi:MAG: aspartate aminotransferase family protein [Candidatus Bathyarchaeota archaeon]|nr:aspartate aminotransferase family protein [Candidatus Bathyarchaeota archaeon]